MPDLLITFGIAVVFALLWLFSDRSRRCDACRQEINPRTGHCYHHPLLGDQRNTHVTTS